jgi:hypothetical protein
VPSITALLDKTGEFYKRTQKRYDDAALIVAEIAKRGYESERGREALPAHARRVRLTRTHRSLFAQLPELTLMDQLIHESLWLYPLVWSIARRTIENV